MSPKEVNQVHEMTQYDQLLRVHATNSGAQVETARGRRDEISTGMGGQLVIPSEKDTRQASEVGQPTGASGGESSLNPIKSIGDATANDLERCKHMQRLPPKAKYFRPLTTQQELGWRPPIELFGTDLGHNIQRNDELREDVLCLSHWVEGKTRLAEARLMTLVTGS
ncbi:hypothetical protein FOZ60_004209 [Perkinsus olseni]|uniref:Uncharacterized protein n=1 Tax=Perkinsus olseni TaxID=32597 RepID=A0A7J6NUJ1_PEROL|nr:hypothetical protein FOZ60_004209 [Perkinsus olseni]